ncbi:MAG: hypothetical protein M1828_006801 [Chrysothrix sp. TS-e1954]|nr:MAG: hypothetical protein M1828_006801 [Chrysothrix sp. TS-e1954]
MGDPKLWACVAFLVFYVSYRILKKQQLRRADERFAVSKGCRPVRKWNAKWPLGLDMLVKAFKHGREEKILRWFLDVVADNGVTFEQKLLFARGVNTTEPPNIETILSSQFSDFGLGLRPPTFAPLLGSGIFTQDEAEWKHSRELLRPQFMSNRSQNFDQVKDCVQNLIDCVPEDALVDLQPLFFRLTLDTTTFLLFGRQLSSLKSEGVVSRESDFASAFNLGQDYLALRGRLGDFYWMLGGRQFRKACATCHQFVDRMVQNSLQRPAPVGQEDSKNNYIFLDALVRETRDPKVLRDQLLRLYPSVPINSRAAKVTTTLPRGGGEHGEGPVLVRKGEAVGYCVYAMHRRKDIYGPDALDFRPERWESDELKDVGWGYLPFNGGPRACLGQDFALLEAAYTVTRLIQVFGKIEMVEDEKKSDTSHIGEERQTLTLVVASGEGCRVKMVR